jgi:hypothetical protein
MICPTGTAQKVPQADATGEAAVDPAVYAIPTNSFSIPVAVGNCHALDVTVEPVANSGSAEVYARAIDTAAWYLLDTIDTSGGTASARYNAPIGQIRVKILTVASAKVYVQGLAAFRS